MSSASTGRSPRDMAQRAGSPDGRHQRGRAGAGGGESRQGDDGTPRLARVRRRIARRAKTTAADRVGRSEGQARGLHGGAARWRADGQRRLRAGRAGSRRRRCATEPAMPQALLMLGSSYLELGRTKDAEGPIRSRAQGRSAERAGVDRHGERPAGRRADRRRRDALQADAVAGRAQLAGVCAAWRRLHRVGSSRRQRCRISKRPWRFSPRSRRTD